DVELIFYFFFSSRRRHTRFSRDWSSDVCSSDLLVALPLLISLLFYLLLKRKRVTTIIYGILMSILIIALEIDTEVYAQFRYHLRSEERRVGKECSTRVVPDPDVNKNINAWRLRR